MEDVIYKTEDNSLEIRLHFIVKNNLKLTYIGKCWPKQTQCLMYFNGLLKCFETITKHVKDDDNEKKAYKIVGEKCLKNINIKWIRSEVRVRLDQSIIKLDI